MGHDSPRRASARSTPEEISAALRTLLDRSSTPDDRVELLASAMVIEALQPHWHSGRSAGDAHEALRQADPEIADAIEAIAPMLLARLEARNDSVEAILSVERLLGLRPAG